MPKICHRRRRHGQALLSGHLPLRPGREAEQRRRPAEGELKRGPEEVGGGGGWPEKLKRHAGGRGVECALS